MNSPLTMLAQTTAAMLDAARNAEWERFTELDLEREVHYRQVMVEVDVSVLDARPELREVLDIVVAQSREIEGLLAGRCTELQSALFSTNRQQKLQKVYR